jgi:CRP-like cAMP-binding protein
LGFLVVITSVMEFPFRYYFMTSLHTENLTGSDKENFENILHDRPELADEFAHVLSDRNQVLDAIRSDHPEPVQVQQANYLASIRRFFRLH